MYHILVLLTEGGQQVTGNQLHHWWHITTTYRWLNSKSIGDLVSATFDEWICFNFWATLVFLFSFIFTNWDKISIPYRYQTLLKMSDTKLFTCFTGPKLNSAFAYGCPCSWCHEIISSQDTAHVKYADPNFLNTIQMAYANALELLQSCTKPSIWYIYILCFPQTIQHMTGQGTSNHHPNSSYFHKRPLLGTTRHYPSCDIIHHYIVHHVTLFIITLSITVQSIPHPAQINDNQILRSAISRTPFPWRSIISL